MPELTPEQRKAYELAYENWHGDAPSPRHYDAPTTSLAFFEAGLAAVRQVGAGEDPPEPYELRSARYEIKRATQELDKIGVEKFDNREPSSDSTDESIGNGSEFSIQYRIEQLARLLRRAQAKADMSEPERAKLTDAELARRAERAVHDAFANALWPGKPGEHRYIAHGLDPYHAANLLEALKLVPDTGDWHGSLRAACQIALQDHPDEKPNQSAEQMMARNERVAQLERALSAILDCFPLVEPPKVLHIADVVEDARKLLGSA